MMRAIPALVNLAAIVAAASSPSGPRYMERTGGNPSLAQALNVFSARKFRSANTHRGKRGKSHKDPHRGTAKARGW